MLDHRCNLSARRTSQTYYHTLCSESRISVRYKSKENKGKAKIRKKDLQRASTARRDDEPVDTLFSNERPFSNGGWTLWKYRCTFLHSLHSEWNGLKQRAHLRSVLRISSIWRSNVGTRHHSFHFCFISYIRNKVRLSPDLWVQIYNRCKL